MSPFTFWGLIAAFISLAVCSDFYLRFKYSVMEVENNPEFEKAVEDILMVYFTQIGKRGADGKSLIPVIVEYFTDWTQEEIGIGIKMYQIPKRIFTPKLNIALDQIVTPVGHAYIQESTKDIIVDWAKKYRKMYVCQRLLYPISGFTIGLIIPQLITFIVTTFTRR